MQIVANGESGKEKFVTAGEQAYSGVYFTGKHVADVLNGAELAFPEDPDRYRGSYEGRVPGLPVNGWEGDVAEFSHIELQNSLMSHQSYRNWNTLMEAELAVMQDLGLSLDRREWYGYSIYNSGITFTNTNPYYARESGQWLVGQPSTTPWGVGLHIYGSNNTVTQIADLLADGAYALGIRVDGQNNNLTVGKGARVQANGLGGIALLVSYGKEHNVQLDGSAIALGEEGIAARFDFGDNEMGNNWEYRGSWMRTTGSPDEREYSEKAHLPSELKGSLVETFNVTGLLAGKRAAIYIADNALVEKINILSGASVYGDIISHWSPEDSRIQAEQNHLDRDELYTQLTFGQRQGSDGTLTDDNGFALTLHGSIQGDGINMSHKAGRLEVLGSIQVANLENHGTLALYSVNEDGYAATVDHFENASGSTLETGFASNGSVTKVQAHTALLNGTLALRPVADFYESNKIISLNDPLEVDTASGKFEALVLTNASPTLTFAQLKNSEELQVQAIRSRAAYSQYAGNSGAASLGRSLAHAASRATGDMQNLLEALDWSSRDGHEVSRALDTLGAEAYDASARASLAQQSEFNLLILRRMLGNESTRRTLAMRGTTHEDQPDAENWQFWATPYGSGAWQGSHGGVSSWKSSGIGLIVGADRYFESGLMLGAHAALAARRTHVAGNHEAQADTQSAFIGLQGMLAPDSWDGFWFAAQGRLGIESGEMDREVSFNGYIRNNESRWSGFSGSALLGGGKDWSWKIGDGHLNAGPLAWMEYSFLHRPGIEEQSGQASRLDVDETVYQSLLFSLGAQAGLNITFENGTSLGVDLLAAWRHETLDATFRTGASFREYGNYNFATATDLPGRDSMLVQSSLRFTHPSNFFVQVELGGEFFRTDYTAMNVGLQLGWDF